MKKIVIAGILFLSGIASAYADNMVIEDAIKQNPDLKVFYQALVNTGVNHELNPDMSYTIFAPTNEAFAKIRQDQYPCFYMVECRAEVAEIVRNHIMPDRIYMSDAARQKGGFFSLGGRFVTIGVPDLDDVTMDGHTIIRASRFGSNRLYKINGGDCKPA